MSPLLLLLISLALGFTAVLALRMHGTGRVTALPSAVFLFLLMVVSITYLAADYFTGQGIDESVAFHLRYGLSEAGHGEYVGLAALVLISLHLAVTIAVFTYFLISRATARRSRALFTAGVVLLVCAFALNPGIVNLRALLSLGKPMTSEGQVLPLADRQEMLQDTQARLRQEPLPAAAQGSETAIHQQSDPRSRPMNIVFIYLEGLEQTYFDESLFPGLVPGLIRMRSQGISFTDLDQIYGTGWTIAGMVASQCGVPLVTTSGPNSMSGMNVFLPGAPCIGDILRDHGYTLTYMGGAPLDFAGKGKFFETHGFSNVYGLQEILARMHKRDDETVVFAANHHEAEQQAIWVARVKEMRPVRWLRERISNLLRGRLDDGDFVHAWGIYDEVLLGIATEKFQQLAARDQPFALFLLTLDTHHPAGHLSPSCADRPYGDGGNPMLNAVHCADLLVSSFLDRIMSDEHARNTMIIVASDHLALRNTAWDLLEQRKRRNLLFVLHPDMKEGPRIDKPGSMLDVGPTILGLLGLEPSGIGYGRDLLSGELTLVQRHDDVDAFLRSQREHLTRLWEFPQIEQGFLVNAAQRRADFKDRSVNIPALLTLDAQLNVREIYFASWSDLTLMDYLLEFIPDQAWIWMDTCRNIAAVASGPSVTNSQDMCMAIGRLNAEHIPIYHVRRKRFFDRQVAETDLAGNADMDLVAQRRTRLRNLSRFDVHELEELPSLRLEDAMISGSLVASSFGGFARGPSGVVSMPSRGGDSLLNLETGTAPCRGRPGRARNRPGKH
jgi:phosphoglycerol transferase